MKKSQRQLLRDLRRVTEFKFKNTHQIAVLLGHRQAYESSLRDRLMRLEKLGLLDMLEIKKGDRVLERKWCLSYNGLEMLRSWEADHA